VCSHCGQPQRLAETETYFSVLGVEARFGQNPAELQQNFYAASRVLHPDRFTTAGMDARLNSLERMSFLNEAYRTLKDRQSLRDYFLRIEGVHSEACKNLGDASGGAARGGIPAEITHDWFELQDTLFEDPVSAAPQLKAFAAKLEEQKAESEKKLSRLEKEIDAVSGAPESRKAMVAPLLDELQKELHAQSYLKSLSNTVERELNKRGLKCPA
jgi:curved DNA-binding protein CbpA